MTISYPDSFLRVLFRWRGSAWRAVWKEMLVWLCLYYAIKLSMHFLLFDRADIARVNGIISQFEMFTNKVPLEFLLGFYVVQVVNRWWKQVQTVPWPDEALVWMNALFPGNDRQSKLMRHTLARYMILCQTLALRSISTRIRKRFPTMEKVVEAGLMSEKELKLIMQCPCPNLRWQLPIHWAVNGVIVPATGTEPGQIPLVVTGNLINLLNSFRTSLRELFMYDWVCFPLVYAQTVGVVVYGYFAMCLIGHQYHGPWQDIYVPVLTILQFVFYVGWLKVAQDLMRPFGEDDDDVELNYILDRHTGVAFSLVHDVCNTNPSLVEDGLFKNANKTTADGRVIGNCVRLPYTKDSLKHRDHPPPQHANVKFKGLEQIEMVYRNPIWVSGNNVDRPMGDGANARGTGLLRRTVSNWFKTTTASNRDDQDDPIQTVHF